MDVNLCPECKIPEPFNIGQEWLNNGDIVQKANPEARLCFIECENLDPLFANIGDVIGMNIENMVMNITARGTEKYMSSLIPAEIKAMVQSKQLDPNVFLQPVLTYCHVVGFGKYQVMDSRYERDDDDFSITRIEAPFSVPEAAGAIAGVLSATVGGEHAVSYKEVSPGTYDFTTSWTEYPEILAERLQTSGYQHRDGDLELERCASCGLPKAFSGFNWYLDRGLIVNGNTKRRMAVLGPELLDVLFRALEAELGATIPATVVEAQRRFVKTGFFSIDELSDEGDFRTQLALRGMGNLRELKMGSQGIHLRVDNAACILLMVGMVQGLFEMIFDVDSMVEWELSTAGDLEVDVRPRGVMANA